MSMQSWSNQDSPLSGDSPDSIESLSGATESSQEQSGIPVFRFVENVTAQPPRVKETEIAARRAHAARVSHQRRKERLSFRNPPQQPSLLPSTSTTSSPDRRISAEVGANSVSEDEDPRDTGSTGQSLVRSDAESANPTATGPIVQLNHRLDQGRIDPFRRTDMRSLPRILRHALEYALEVYWPMNVNSGPADKSYTLTLRRASAQNQYTFHAVVAAAAILLHRNTSNQKVRLACSALMKLHRSKAIRLINEEIEKLGGQLPSDELVVSIVAVASEPPVHKQVPAPEQLSKSPLAKAQNLHYYSTQSVDPEYTKAFVRIIELKGGLDGIQSPALATLTELFDLMVASMTGAAPRYAWRHPRRALLTYEIGGLILDPISAMLLKDLGCGFDRHIFLALLPTVSQICELIIALDRFVRNEPGATPMYDLIHVRNAIQHSLCSLPHIPEPETIEQALQEICRTALLCFSDLVIFPIPEQTGVRARLVTQLYTSLRLSEKFTAWQTQHAHFLLWATTIGSVASINLPIRSSFSTLLRWVLLDGNMAWPDLKDHQMNFIWWDFVCDEPARSMYAEATMSTPWARPVDTDLPFADFG